MWMVDMKLLDLHEGMMKRSDPYVSGEVSKKPEPKTPPKKSAHATKIANLAKKAGKSEAEVDKLWQDVKRDVDLKIPNAFGIVMSRVQKSLGLREEKEFNDDENGSLVYGWKSVKELNAEEGKGYVPPGYAKVLELGGIYANEPGKGQGDKLMKHFLASQLAKDAELIFLDPVSGLGRNFHSEKSEDEQVKDLKRFYARYGFRNNPKSNRMWLVKKGEIPTDRLPT